MDLVKDEEIFSESSDVNLMKTIPSKNNAVKNGIIASISLCDGKFIKAIFNFLNNYDSILFEFTPDFLIIRGSSYIGSEVNGKINFETFIKFMKNDQLEYSFCPQNIQGSNKESICLNMSSESLSSCVSKCKVGTSLRLEFNKRKMTDMVASITNGDITIKKEISININKTVKRNVSTISENNEPNCHIISDLLSTCMGTNSVKHRGVFYGTIISIFNEGMSIQSQIPKTEAITFGDASGNSTDFHIDHKTTLRMSKILKVSSKTPISIYNCEDFFKISFRVGAFAELSIKQYSNNLPHQSSSTQSNQMTAGISQIDNDNFNNYKNQLISYYNKKIELGTITQELVNYEMKTKLSEAWNLITTKTSNKNRNENDQNQSSMLKNSINAFVPPVSVKVNDIQCMNNLKVDQISINKFDPMNSIIKK